MNETMEQMFSEAMDTGKWFYCRYQDLWFPWQELRQKQSEGRFNWGPKNWELRDPWDQVREIDKRLANLQQRRQSIIESIAKYQKSEK